MPLERWKTEFAATVNQHRKEGWGWRYDGLESWPTDKIFAQLRELGIDTDAERFHEQALKARRISVLDDDWDSQLSEKIKSTGFWQDFPLLAVPVLWDRLASDLICPELIDLRLHRVLDAEDADQPLENVEGLPAAIAAAKGLVQYLQGFPAAERPARFDEIRQRGTYDYSAWLVELLEQHGADYPDLAAQLADVMADCPQAEHFQTELAIALAIAGRREEAQSRARVNLQRYPDDFWVKILTADVFIELNEDAQAIDLLVQALASAGDCFDWDAIVERLEELFERSGSVELLTAIVRQNPRPTPATSPTSALSEPDVSARLEKATKIGRNDPCPCGSGKKYKKCCLP
jgi:hypothetical protein